MFSSLRLRLTLWYVAILAVILLAVGALVYVLVARSLDAQINASLSEVNQRAMAAASLAPSPVGVDGRDSGRSEGEDEGGERRGEHDRDADFTPLVGREALGGAAGVFVLAVDANGGILANPNNVPTEGLPDANALAVARREGQDRRDVRAGGSRLRLLTVAVGSGEHGDAGFIITGRSLSQRDGDLRRLLVLLVIGGSAGLVMAGLGGLWVGELAIRPIRAAFARQRDFIADASHELRTPITVIRANAESLQGKASPADAEALQDIVDESEQISRLIGDLLTLAQADRAGLELRTGPVDLYDIIAYVTRAGQRLAEGRRLTIDAHPEHVVVHGDVHRLRELAMILVDNAIKYTEAGGTVAVSAGRAGNQGLLLVRDTGVGIPPEHLPRLFDRFYRVDKARSRAQSGFGLGLSIAQAIVQAHGGQIEVASEPGKGTTVRVLLPLQPSVAEATRALAEG